MRRQGLFSRDAVTLPSVAAALATESQTIANSSKVSVEAMFEDHNWTLAAEALVGNMGKQCGVVEVGSGLREIRTAGYNTGGMG